MISNVTRTISVRSLLVCATHGMLLVALSAQSASAQIAFDQGTSSSANGSTLAYDHTIGGGTNRLLVVTVAIEASSPANTDLTVTPTYNGVDMTLATDRVTGTSFGMHTYMWYMLEADLPAAGTYSVSLTAGNADNITSGAVSVTNVAQQPPEVTGSSADDQAGDDVIQTGVTTLTDGAWLFDCVGSGNAVSGYTPDGGQIERWDVAASSSRGAGSTAEQPSAGAITLGWTAESSSNRIAHVVAGFAPAECAIDPDCDDGVFCNGPETCAGFTCQAGAAPCPIAMCDEINDTCMPQTAQLEAGVVAADGTAVTVNLANTYSSPVVVCSGQYDNNTVPIVPRVSNVTATSFDVRLVNPSGTAVVSDTINYVVVEEGTWTVDGVDLEARTYNSTITDSDGSWVGTAQTYSHTYNSPVVLGQVMTENDASWSVFWCQGASRTDPPSPTALVTGKTVCEDPSTTRVDETVGFIVFEAGHGTIGGVDFEALLGSDTVQGVDNAPPYTYTFDTAFNASPQVAVLTMSGVDGVNGGWAQTMGAAPLTAQTMDLVIDEDQINDPERNHTAEQVAYVVFETPMVYPPGQCVVDGDCTDGNVCTTDTCTAGVCSSTHNTATCDDGDACTTSDTCSAGTCVGGPPPDCDDGNVCTTDSCDPVLGCQNINNTAPCDDGNACTTVDACSGGTCAGSVPPNCDDGNVCTDDSCDPVLGCQQVNNTAPCDDADACTTLDTCAAGTCVGGVPPDCDDGNVCTDDSCDSVLGCQNSNNGISCDDGDACTTFDTCAGGACVGGSAPDCNDGNVCTDDSCDPGLGCQNINNAAPCDDGDACSTIDVCAGGTCTGSTPPDCDDGNPCTDDACNPSIGCVSTNNNSPCDDGVPCTSGDTCSGGTCAGSAVDCSGLDDACNAGVCETGTGACVTQPVNDGGACDDGDLCTTADECTAGTCLGIAIDCSGLDDTCNTGVCNATTGACQALPTNRSGPCDDGNPCTTTDACAAGVCVGQAIPGCQLCATAGDCDDGNPCTDDTCPAGTCQYTNNLVMCDDGDLCTSGDVCAAGACTSGAPVDCSGLDGACTLGACNAVTGLCEALPANEGSTCDDGDLCTIDDVCTGGVCGGAAVDCSGLNDACNTGTCNPADGTCMAAPSNEGGGCDDAVPCTTGDVCTLGLCGGNPVDCSGLDSACTQGTCNALSGMCDAAPINDGGACDDADPCTTTDQCVSGICTGTTTDCSGLDDNCIVGVCNGSTGLCTPQPANEGGSCDDGDLCTGSDACMAGTCVGVAVDCSGLNDTCNIGVCNATSGACDAQTINEGGACDDADLCSTGDVCTNGTCTGTATDCSGLDDVCNQGVCNPVTGACTAQPVNEGGACDDASLCTTGDACVAGVCTGTAVDCSGLDDACNAGVCNPATGLCQTQPANESDPCDDNDVCTSADECNAGLCIGSPIPGCQLCASAAECDDGNPCTDDTCPSGSCVFTANTTPCDDGDACTTGDTCSAGTCLSGVTTDCSGLDSACTVGVCNSISGLCSAQSANEGGPCDDANACTTADTCVAGTCVGGTPPDCDDGNACTDDSCDALAGCQSIDNAAPCDDGDACTTADMCIAGVCTGGAAPNCNDGNACTDDSCDTLTGCMNVNNAASCDDANACTTSDTCNGGVCTGGPAPDCDDSNPCTTDSCDTILGCQNTHHTAACDDGDACTTTDVCSAGSCIGGPPANCNDGNPCTDDSCDPVSGCQNVDNTAACDDGDACTTIDMCVGGLCVGGAPISCADGNVCTDDVCDPVFGCQNPNNVAPCDDGDVCTTGDACALGSCVPGAGIDCSSLDGDCGIGVCNTITGACEVQAANEGASCDDGTACTTGDTCSAGVCSGAPVPACQPCIVVADCDDGNPCSDEACVDGACVFTGNTAPCEDGDPCTSGDICANGLCSSGGATDCDDGNPCTDDSCDSLTGCVNAANMVPCDDGAPCTTNDTCTGGVCSGTLIPKCTLCVDDNDCDDGNVCTDDACSAGSCIFTANTATCDDGDACTVGDVCAGETCISGPPLDCDDGNLCTDDSCDTALGCLNIDNVDPCDDGDACTTGDACSASGCAGTPVDCSGLDGPCTAGACNALSGVCEAQPINEGTSCSDGLFCNGAETCAAGVCAAVATPCEANPNATCDEATDTCINECTFDCNLNSVIDTGDYSFFLGCFGEFINPGDACECADFNDNGVGDTGDYAGLLGCFGMTCPCPGGPAPTVEANAEVRVVLRDAAGKYDYADTLPKSLRTVRVGDELVAEVWLTVDPISASALACAVTDVAVDAPFDIDHATASDALPVFDLTHVDARYGQAQNIGGCIASEQLDTVPHATWIRIATLELSAVQAGIALIMPQTASGPHVGIALVGQDRNLADARVIYRGARVVVRDPLLDARSR